MRHDESNLNRAVKVKAKIKKIQSDEYDGEGGWQYDPCHCL